MRHPPGASAEASPNTAFLFRVMCSMSQMVSIFEPVSPQGRRSHSTRWFSVPSVTSLYPSFISAAASAAALALTCLSTP